MKKIICTFLTLFSITAFSQSPYNKIIDFIIDKDTTRFTAPYQVLGIEPNYYIADSVYSIILIDNSIKYDTYYNIIYNTCISTIPKEIEFFKNLESLYCQSCIKKEVLFLPRSFNKLNKLKYIDFRAFNIDKNTFPEGFDSLKNIKEFFLGNIIDTFIPKSFFKLDSLEEIQIGFNGIKNVRKLNQSLKEFGLQKELKYIRIWNYRINKKDKEFLIKYFRKKGIEIRFDFP